MLRVIIVFIPATYFLRREQANGWALRRRWDRRDTKIVVARNIANRVVHTNAEGGQVEALLGFIDNM
jgi:hypothetical protein